MCDVLFQIFLYFVVDESCTFGPHYFTLLLVVYTSQNPPRVFPDCMMPADMCASPTPLGEKVRSSNCYALIFFLGKTTHARDGPMGLNYVPGEKATRFRLFSLSLQRYS